MGMYDNVNVYYKMPDPEIQDEVFQTKSFECAMDDYTITEEGRLILHKAHWEPIPEEERPYYGKPEWEKPGLWKAIGSMKTVYDGDEDIDFHGIIEIHTILDGFSSPKDSDWYSYNLKFTDGILKEITKNENSF